MWSRKVFYSAVFVCLVLSSFAISSSQAANTTDQILTQVDDILNANPLKEGEKIQIINVAQDDTVSCVLIRFTEGAEIKPHFHKTHDETVYVIKGSGQMLVNDKWIDVKPGMVHFNPMNKVHSTRNTGKEPLVIFSIYTPSMKEPDRNFVE
ncbi:MAG: cupin domain-containing protein [Syntrophobacteraceae bacterium]|jgi:mannose-6-phosphate isomerase-like protein (cupin superfamily)